MAQNAYSHAVSFQLECKTDFLIVVWKISREVSHVDYQLNKKWVSGRVQ